MWIVFAAAIGVGGATMLGGVLGALLRIRSEKADGIVFAFACGVMFAAGVIELILPAVEGTGLPMFAVCLASIVAGGGMIALFGGCLPRFERRLFGRFGVAKEKTALARKVFLFIAAITIHNLPEGIASGVGFGTENTAGAIAMAAGVALQNLPEGMIVIRPLTLIGFSRRKALGVAVFTGAVEIVGTFLGYFAAMLSASLLPPVLCLAAGAMLYIICGDVLAEATEMAGGSATGFGFLAGFCCMMVLERAL